MTENEVFEHIGDLAGDYKCFDEKISHQESLILCNLIEEIQQYRAIGAVEEFKALKEKKNVLPIATITFSKEQLQEIVDEKMEEIELDIQKIRAKAIDGFAEELNNSIDMLDLNYEYRCDGGVQHQTLNNMRIMIQEIAEQLKAGGIDG